MKLNPDLNASWLLRSSILGWAMGLSLAASVLVLFLSPGGMPSLRKRRAELSQMKQDLLQKSRANRELAAEVRRLAAKDPELMEALCRRQGYARPGETVYTFRGNSDRR